MQDVDELLALVPVGDIAKQLGIPENVARDAVSQVIPTLLSGMAANASDSSGAASLERALAGHAGVVPSGSVSEIDTDDGEKIVSNVFGSRKNDVVAAVASTGDSTVTQDIIAKVLPIVAPLVLTWLASRFLGKKQAAPAESASPAPSGGIGEILGGLLGGAKGSSPGGNILGSVLGGLLGGGKR
ncbi:MAG: DUF937 domain-containing protein [Rhodoglobus sp.]